MGERSLYDDPELYDLLFPAAKDMTSVHDAARKQRFIASEQFYLDEARRRDGRVLELGCGSGRLTLQIAQDGIDIVGADLSGSMLDAARTKALAAGLDVPFVQADMRHFDLAAKFSTILITQAVLRLRSPSPGARRAPGVRHLEVGPRRACARSRAALAIVHPGPSEAGQNHH